MNQVQFHVGMSADPEGVKSYADGKGVVTQAYSPLGDGSSELITGPLVTGIGKNYNKSGAAVSLRWLKEHNVPLSTKATNPLYLKENLDAVAGARRIRLQPVERHLEHRPPLSATLVALPQRLHGAAHRHVVTQQGRPRET